MCHDKSDKDMKEVIIYLLAILIVIGCKVHKSTQKTTERFLSVDQKLAELSNYLELQWDNTYNFRHDRIRLPNNYRTSTWTNQVGESWKGDEIDSLSIKYLIYGNRLDSLLNSEYPKIHYRTIIEIFGRPSITSTYKNQYVTDLNFLFNTELNPNCSCRNSKNDYFGSNCSIIDFEIDKEGNLIKINTLLFGP